MRRRQQVLVGLVCVGGLVVSACSGGAEPASDATSADGMKFGEVGGAIDGADAERSTEALSIDDSATAGAPVPSTTTPGVEAVSAARAGSVDDNAAWDEYLLYRQWFDAQGPVWPILPIAVEGRHVLTVTDEAGLPVRDAGIEVVDDAGTVVARLRTYGDGRALFHPPPDVDPDDQDVASYRAVATGLGVSVEQSLDGGIRDHALVLPASRATSPVPLDVVFLLDATGSMADEIDRLKATISTVSEQLGGLPGAGDLRLGLTAYRDVGDEYVTRSVPLTSDVSAFAGELDAVVADGGGDRPEALEEGLHEVIDGSSWRDDAMKVVFRGAYAPPQGGGDGPGYDADVVAAAAAGIKVFPIASSGLADDPQGEYVFRQLAQITLGRFVFLTYGADGATPGDGTAHQVEPGSYAVLPLDELVVRLVAEELAPQAGS
jgi:hypothetical protein